MGVVETFDGTVVEDRHNARAENRTDSACKVKVLAGANPLMQKQCCSKKERDMISYCFKPMRRTYTLKLEVDIVQPSADLCEEEIQAICESIEDQVGVRPEVVNDQEIEG